MYTFMYKLLVYGICIVVAHVHVHIHVCGDIMYCMCTCMHVCMYMYIHTCTCTLMCVQFRNYLNNYNVDVAHVHQTTIILLRNYSLCMDMLDYPHT